MSTELKIKYLSLASEAQTIRLERLRLKIQNAKIAAIRAGKVYLETTLKDKITRMIKHMDSDKLSISVLVQIRDKLEVRSTQLRRLKLCDVSPVSQLLLDNIANQRHINMQAMNRIQLHKVNVVRTEARSTHLARNFLKGTSYERVECSLRKTTGAPNFKAIEKMVKRYGSGDSRVLMQKFSEWIDAAEYYINHNIQ